MTTRITSAARNRRVLANVAGGLLARVCALILQFYSTRLMLQLMGVDSLGIWLVVLGILQWVTYFDFGIGYGARNELARNLASSDTEAAARTIATGYLYCLYVAVVLGLISGVLILTPLNSWLTATVFSGHDMGQVLLLCLLAFLLNFVLSFVLQIYAALEQGAAASINSLLVNLLLVLALWCLPDKQAGIDKVALVYCVAMTFPSVLLSGWLFFRFPALRPRRPAVDHGLRPIILNVGLRLFVIQLCALVIFATDRLIVSAIIGPQAVVVYDAAFKIFGLLTMVHGLIMGVLWSSFTHAHAQGDWLWIRQVLHRLQWLTLPLALASFLLALSSPWLVRAWLGEVAVGSALLYAGFAIYALLSCWSNIWAYFLNGIGETRAQMYSGLCAAAVNIPLAWLFSNGLGFGEAGVIWATVVSLIFFSVIGPLEAARVMRKGALQA